MIFGVKRLERASDWEDIVSTKNWVSGHSVFQLAHKWHLNSAFPPAVATLFRSSEVRVLMGMQPEYLWNTLSGQAIYEINKAPYSDIFMMLDDEETEDLVYLYLQSKGWYVVPHSRKGDTMTFEYLCVNPLTGQVTGTQVKTGEAPLNRDDYAEFPHKTFLFQSNDLYLGKGADNIESIPRGEILEFLKESASWLPKSFKRKIDIVNLPAPNRVAGGFCPPAPTPSGMRVRTGRFTEITGPIAAPGATPAQLCYASHEDLEVIR